MVHNKVSSTKADNLLAWDKEVMVATLIVGLEIDFVGMILVEIHEREFKTSTSYPFLYLIFQLCRDGGVLIRHCDTLRRARRRPPIEVPPLGENLAHMVELAQGAYLSAPKNAEPSPTSSLHAASRAPSPSKFTPPATAVISLARV